MPAVSTITAARDRRHMKPSFGWKNTSLMTAAVRAVSKNTDERHGLEDHARRRHLPGMYRDTCEVRLIAACWHRRICVPMASHTSDISTPSPSAQRPLQSRPDGMSATGRPFGPPRGLWTRRDDNRWARSSGETASRREIGGARVTCAVLRRIALRRRPTSPVHARRPSEGVEPCRPFARQAAKM